jgi:hypothetical protein
MKRSTLLPATLTLAAILALGTQSSLAFAQTTTGPSATLFKLDDHWASISPAATAATAAAATLTSEPAATLTSEPAATLTSEPVAAVTLPESAAQAPAASPEMGAAPTPKTPSMPGYDADANYSGACHVTLNLESKTYVLNPTSSTEMVATELAAGRVCMATESLALEAGFTREPVSR